MVTLFLYPEPNLKLRPKLLRELPRGARIVPYYWDMDDWPPLLRLPKAHHARHIPAMEPWRQA